MRTFFAIPVVTVLVACAHAPSVDHRVPSFDGTPLVAISDDVWADPETTPVERENLAKDFIAARQKLAEALGPLRSSAPMAIFCKSQRCAQTFGTPSGRSWTFPKGTRAPGGNWIATRDTIVVLRVDAESMPFAMHEMVHREEAARMHGDSDVPTWFNEGSAAYFANAPACNGPQFPGVDDLRRVETNRAWSWWTDQRGAQSSVYCQAKAEVAAWVAKNGNAKWVELADALGAGKHFNDLYGPMLTNRPRVTPIVTVSTDLGDAKRPFSIALWIKPREASGVLASLSETVMGTGWCSPLLGFDADHHLVAQLLTRGAPELSSFSIARDPNALLVGAWTHVAMTWAPGGMQRLYVNGERVAETKAAGFYANGAGTTMYLAWGSYNLATSQASWPGALSHDDFHGALTGMQLFASELSEAQVRELAKDAP